MCIQCMLIEMDSPQLWINFKHICAVSGSRAGDCKHFFKLCVISGFRCDRSCSLLGCYVAYGKAQKLDPLRW